MKTLMISCAALLSLFMTQPLSSAQCGCGAQPPRLSGGHTWLTDRESAIIPFRLVRDHILVPVRFNGSEPLGLILDTGMPFDGAVLFKGEKVDGLDL
ncbi:MAG: hypothetical protein ACYTG7_16010, partial [Planctomycetota bacterium]